MGKGAKNNRIYILLFVLKAVLYNLCIESLEQLVAFIYFKLEQNINWCVWTRHGPPNIPSRLVCGLDIVRKIFPLYWCVD